MEQIEIATVFTAESGWHYLLIGGVPTTMRSGSLTEVQYVAERINMEAHHAYGTD